MSFLNLLYNEILSGNNAVNRRLTRVFAGEVCLFTSGNGYEKRVAALF